jgi:hypothetical protein
VPSLEAEAAAPFVAAELNAQANCVAIGHAFPSDRGTPFSGGKLRAHLALGVMLV